MTDLWIFWGFEDSYNTSYQVAILTENFPMYVHCNPSLADTTCTQHARTVPIITVEWTPIIIDGSLLACTVNSKFISL